MNLTHAGIVRACDARLPKDWEDVVQLRETKLYWITGSGARFRKRDGLPPGDFPTRRLDLDSVVQLPHTGKDNG